MPLKPYYEDVQSGITIYHGDCRDVLPQLHGDLILSDPPYGVGRTYGCHYDDRRDGYWDWFKPCLTLMRSRAPVVAITHRSFALKELTDWDWVIVWEKPFGAAARIGNSPILPHWEPILLWGIHTLGTKREVLPDVISANPERSPLPQRRISNGHIASRAARAKTDGNIAEHPLPKPLQLFKRLVRGLSDQGETVVDPFMGSGTTLRAAKDLGRRTIGIEIEERYCEIAAKRLSQGVLDFAGNRK